MAKDKKDKKDKKGKKGKGKVPKEVAGVKIPKALRKIGGKAMKLAEQPVVSEIAAAALLAAAAALRDGKGLKAGAGAAADAGEAAGKEAQKAAKEGAREAARLGDALRTLALDLARRTLEGLEEKAGAGPAPRDRTRGGKAPEGAGAEG